MEKIINMFCKEKPVLILLTLNQNADTKKTVSCISRDVNCVFCHVTNIIMAFQKENLVTFKKEGRNKIISLTEKGKRMSTLLEQMIDVDKQLNGGDE